MPFHMLAGIDSPARVLAPQHGAFGILDELLLVGVVAVTAIVLVRLWLSKEDDSEPEAASDPVEPVPLEHKDQ